MTITARETFSAMNNRPLLNFAKTKEKSQGGEDKFAISFIQTKKNQICPLKLNFVLLFLHNSKVAYCIGDTV